MELRHFQGVEVFRNPSPSQPKIPVFKAVTFSNYLNKMVHWILHADADFWLLILVMVHTNKCGTQRRICLHDMRLLVRPLKEKTLHRAVTHGVLCSGWRVHWMFDHDRFPAGLACYRRASRVFSVMNSRYISPRLVSESHHHTVIRRPMSLLVNFAYYRVRAMVVFLKPVCFQKFTCLLGGISINQLSIDEWLCRSGHRRSICPLWRHRADYGLPLEPVAEGIVYAMRWCFKLRNSFGSAV